MSNATEAMIDYQAWIANGISNQNVIVALPSGSGKFQIAAAIAKKMDRSFKTLVLVSSAAEVRLRFPILKEGTNRIVSCYAGGELPSSGFQLLLSTPAAYGILAKRYPQLYGIDLFQLVIFDEVQRCLQQRHPFYDIMNQINLCADSKPLVVGLGSTSALSQGVVRRLLADSLFSLTGIASVTSEVLRASGVTSFCIHRPLTPPKEATTFYDWFMSYRTDAGMKNLLSLLATQIEDWLSRFDDSYSKLHTISTIDDCAPFIRSKIAEETRIMDSRSDVLCVLGYLEHIYEALHVDKLFSTEIAMQYLSMVGFFDGLDDHIDSKKASKEVTWHVNSNLFFSPESIPVDSSLLYPLIHAYGEWLVYRSQDGKLSWCKRELQALWDQNPADGLKCVVVVKHRICAHILHHSISTDEELKYLGDCDFMYASTQSLPCDGATPGGRCFLAKEQNTHRMSRFYNRKAGVMVAFVEYADHKQFVEDVLHTINSLYAKQVLFFDAPKVPLDFDYICLEDRINKGASNEEALEMHRRFYSEIEEHLIPLPLAAADQSNQSTSQPALISSSSSSSTSSSSSSSSPSSSSSTTLMMQLPRIAPSLTSPMGTGSIDNCSKRPCPETPENSAIKLPKTIQIANVTPVANKSHLTADLGAAMRTVPSPNKVQAQASSSLSTTFEIDMYGELREVGHHTEQMERSGIDNASNNSHGTKFYDENSNETENELVDVEPVSDSDVVEVVEVEEEPTEESRPSSPVCTDGFKPNRFGSGLRTPADREMYLSYLLIDNNNPVDVLKALVRGVGGSLQAVYTEQMEQGLVTGWRCNLEVATRHLGKIQRLSVAIHRHKSDALRDVCAKTVREIANMATR